MSSVTTAPVIVWSTYRFIDVRASLNAPASDSTSGVASTLSESRRSPEAKARRRWANMRSGIATPYAMPKASRAAISAISANWMSNCFNWLSVTAENAPCITWILRDVPAAKNPVAATSSPMVSGSSTRSLSRVGPDRWTGAARATPSAARQFIGRLRRASDP